MTLQEALLRDDRLTALENELREYCNDAADMAAKQSRAIILGDAADLVIFMKRQGTIYQDATAVHLEYLDRAIKVVNEYAADQVSP